MLLVADAATANQAEIAARYFFPSQIRSQLTWAWPRRMRSLVICIGCVRAWAVLHPEHTKSRIFVELQIHIPSRCSFRSHLLRLPRASSGLKHPLHV
jgi:hypothetical protein